MQKNNKKLFARISSIVVACVSALLLCISPFMPKIQPETMIASADTSSPNYSFDGSALYFPFTVSASDSSGQDFGTHLDLSFFVPRISMSRTGFVLNYFCVEYRQLNNVLNQFEQSMYKFSYSSSFVFDTNTEFYLQTLNSNLRIVAFYNCSSNFNFNVYKVRLYTDTSSKPANWNHIVYYDENDNTCDFAFWFYASDPTDLVISDRVYYLTNSLSDSQTFRSGYESGYNSGYAEGENVGNSSGQQVGYNQGYQVGYSDGVNATNTYSFFNLISAVIDAPVQAFIGLFNFELLGVNLAGFFTGLLTLAFIVTVVKLLL